MTVAEMDMYIQSIDEVENRIVDNSRFPIVKDNKIKICCKTTLELTKVFLNYLKYNINNAPKETKSKINNKNE